MNRLNYIRCQTFLGILLIGWLLALPLHSHDVSSPWEIGRLCTCLNGGRLDCVLSPAPTPGLPSFSGQIIPRFHQRPYSLFCDTLKDSRAPPAQFGC